MNGAEVLIKFKGDTSSAGKSIDGLKSKISSLATGLAKGMVAATAIATGAIAKMTKSAIDGFAEYEQLMGGVETLFGTGGMTVEEYAKKVGKSVSKVQKEYDKLDEAQERVAVHAWEAYQTAGLSVNEYMSTVTSFSAALKQSIKDPVKLAEAADQAVIDMSDNANKMGTNMELIQSAYQGFAKQNYTMLDNLKLGYGGTKTEMERLLKDASKISGVKYDIKNLGDVYQAIHVIQTELGITGTTAKEASSTIQGSMNMAKKSFQNFLVSLAQGEEYGLEESLETMMDSIETFLDNVMPVVDTVLKNIGKMLPKFMDRISKTLPNLIKSLLPSLIQGAVVLVNGLIQSLPVLIQTLLPELINGVVMITEQIIIMLPELIMMIADMLPTLIPTIVEAILQIIPMLIDHLPEFVEAGFKLFVGILTGLINALPKIFEFGVQMVGKLFEGIKSVVQKIPDFFVTVWNKIWDGIKKFLGGVKDFFKTTFDAIVEVVKIPINWIIDGLNLFIRGLNKIQIPDWVPFVGGKGFHISEIAHLDVGTNFVPEDMFAMIHKGEAVVPKKFNPYANGVNSQTMGAVQNSGNKQVINVYVDSSVDPLGQVVSKIKTFSGGAKNDYNYGYGGM